MKTFDENEKTDEWHQGFADFMCNCSTNPYEFNSEEYDDWEAGWLDAQLTWAELIGA